MNFELIYLEYYNRYRAKTKCNRFAIAKSATDFNFTIVSIVILKIYTFKVQTVNRTFEAPCMSGITLVFKRSLNKLLWNVSSVSLLVLGRQRIRERDTEESHFT